MNNPFHISREERPVALAAAVLLTALCCLPIVAYHGDFLQVHGDYSSVWRESFRISGFDYFSYIVLSDWCSPYDVTRHPLLALFMYVPYLLNKAIITLTGVNATQEVMAVILVTCATYAFLFLYRILHRVLKVGRWEAMLLTGLFFSFAYVTLTVMVPDHFCLSMMMLLLTLWVAASLREEGKTMSVATAFMLVLIAGGITLTTGVKVILIICLLGGKAVRRPKFILAAFILPLLLLAGASWLQEKAFVIPAREAREKMAAQRNEAILNDLRQAYIDSTGITDKRKVEAYIKHITLQRAREKYRRDHSAPRVLHQGAPLAKEGMLRWTDISTSRWETVVENLFGESLQLHQDYLLKDTLVSERPVIVPYRHWWQYAIEAFLVLLFAGCAWTGRHKRLVQTALLLFAFDMVLHIVLGFAINEVYLMTAHWAFAIPLCIGSAFTELKPRHRRWLTAVILLLTAWLFIYNLRLICCYLL